MTTEEFETYAQSWRRRRAQRGEVDFTMMYVAHDAFARDLDRLIAAGSRQTAEKSAVLATWRTFAEMLHLHHTVEDTALWPSLRAAVTSAQDRNLLDAMEAEHAGIDPRVAEIDRALTGGDAADATKSLRELRRELRAHMLHEETEALPLLERTLGAEGWAEFGKAAHKQGGMRAAATMLPWSLDAASKEATTAVLGMLPAPARLIYRWRWASAYAKGDRLR